MTSASHNERRRWLPRIAWWLAPPTIRLVSRVAWRLRVEHGEGFPEPPFVIASNHYSFLDPPIVGAVFGSRVRFLTLADLFGNYRTLDFALGVFEVIRVNRGVKALGPVREALSHLDQGGVVAVFPEGTRAIRFGEKPFAAGASWLAVKAGVPLVPVAITGTQTVLGIGNRLRRGQVKVFIGPSLRPEGSGRVAVNDLTNRWADWVHGVVGNHPS